VVLGRTSVPVSVSDVYGCRGRGEAATNTVVCEWAA
jgi:hypothetical protein